MKIELAKIVYHNTDTQGITGGWKKGEIDIGYDLGQINKYIQKYGKDELLDGLDWLKDFINKV